MSLFTQIKATPSKNGGYVLKLQAKITKQATTAFGHKESTQQQTYYMKVASPTLQNGAAAELDLNLFNIEHLPHTIKVPMLDANNQPVAVNGVPTMVDKVIQLKWLFLK